MAGKIKVFAAKPDEVSSIPSDPNGENLPLKTVLTSTHML